MTTKPDAWEDISATYRDAWQTAEREIERLEALVQRLQIAHDAHANEKWCPICDPELAALESLGEITDKPQVRFYSVYADDPMYVHLVKQAEALRAENERLRAALDAHHTYMPAGDLDPCVICDGGEGE